MSYTGPSAFAIMHKNFPLSRFFKQYPDDIKKPIMPILLNFFTPKIRELPPGLFIDRFSDRPHCLEFFMSFRRPSIFMYTDAVRLVDMLTPLITPNTKIILCPVLEDVAQDKEWRYWAKKLRKISGWDIVRSSLKSNLGGQYQEKHGQYPRFTKPIKKRIANPDGVSIDFGQESYFKQMTLRQGKLYLKRYKKCFAAITWSANQQGLGKATGWGGKGAPPPDKRNYIITSKAIQWHRRNL